MINETTVSSMGEYASDQLAAKERPGTDPVTGDDYYAQGVKPGFSAPAKWWNWLFNALTKRVGEERNDLNVLINELKAVLTEAGVQVSATSNTQLLASVLAILQRIATTDTPGMVKSSSTDGQVQVDPNTGVMQVNGIGDFSSLPPALSSAYTLIDAIDILYTQLQIMSIGVPPQPSTYDDTNPVIDTTTMGSGLEAQFGTVHLDAGWYFVDLSGGGGGGGNTESVTSSSGVYRGSSRTGGFGVRSTGWMFVMSPGDYIYAIGQGGGSSYRLIVDGTTTESRTGGGGSNSWAETNYYKLPNFMQGSDGDANAANTATGGTGGCTMLIACPTQDIYCVSGGSGGNFGVRDYVNLTGAEAYTEAHTEEGAIFYGAYASGESVPASGQFPWGVNGWTKGPGAVGGYVDFAVVEGEPTFTRVSGENGWVKIYRGVTAAPST